MRLHKILKKYSICGVMLLLFSGVLLPINALAKTQTVTSESEFMTALADEEVEKIVLAQTIEISRSMDGMDNAFVIPRPVTISGGGLRLEKAGIVLGESVSLEDTDIYFSNPVRNAIIANGYELSLKNVTSGDSKYGIFVFCGGITDYNGGNPDEIPQTGTKGTVTIQGTNELEDIFAGSFSDVGNQTEDVPNDYSGEASIIIENGATGFGEIFAHGAKENRSGGFANMMIPDANLYKVSGTVTIDLRTHKSITLYGKTGGMKDAVFIYTDNGKGYACSPTLKDIGSIILNPAQNQSKANLLLSKESSFSDKGICFSVTKKTMLDLTELSENMMEKEIDRLYGGGILILKEGQLLSIRGEVSGSTQIAVGGLNFSGEESTGYLEEGQILLHSGQSVENNFTLIPPVMNPEMILAKDEEGNWYVTTEEHSSLIQSITMADCRAETQNNGVEIPVRVVYASEGADVLSFVPVEIVVNGAKAWMGQDDYGYYYVVDDPAASLEFYYTEDSYGNECLYIADLGYETGVVPEGKYLFAFTIPAEYMEDGMSHQFQTELIVGEPAPTETETPVPTETETPAPTETQAPVPTETQEPVPAETETPAPTETQAPAPTETQVPAPSTAVVTEVFEDVYKDWYVEYVQYVYDHGLMTGMKGTRLFAPNGNVTKAQVAQVLYNLEDAPESGREVFHVLSDVYESEWYADAVAWAYEAGVVTGDLNEKKFFPNQDVTREQFALMLYRYSKYKGYEVKTDADFSQMSGSEKISEWSYDGVCWAVREGLITGIERDGIKDLAPQGVLSRAQMAAIFTRFKDKN